MKRQQIEFRRFNHTLGEMEYSSEMAGGLEQFFSNDCCSELADDEQFTGIRDCKDVKIFEGDITKSKHVATSKYKDGTYVYGEVVFEDGMFLGKYTHGDGVAFFDKIKNDEVEVIGNIHQSKELLGDNK